MSDVNDNLTAGLDLDAPVEKSKRVRIFIDESSDSSDLQFVFLSLNGRAYQVKRGVEVDIPAELLEILQHAVVEKEVSDESGAKEFRKFYRFPFRVIGAG